MVYFHGGGFVCGSGIKSNHDPGYFLDHDVILVTANYRLGPIGFLSTEDENCPGNFGLKDQAMVLKWIQTNIEPFGGDRKRFRYFFIRYIMIIININQWSVFKQRYLVRRKRWRC